MDFKALNAAKTVMYDEIGILPVRRRDRDNSESERKEKTLTDAIDAISKVIKMYGGHTE